MPSSLYQVRNNQLAVLGLIQMGYTDHGQLSRLTGCDTTTIENLVAKRGGTGSIARALSEGLPVGRRGDLLAPVRCPVCQGHIVVVPCVLCYQGTWKMRTRRPARDRRTKPLVTDGCQAEPGSAGKIRVMQARLKRGRPLFSDSDPQYVPSAPRVVLVRSTHHRRLGGEMTPMSRPSRQLSA